MSENNGNNEKKKYSVGKSIFAELNAVSITTLCLIALLLIAAIAVYIFTVVPPAKKVMVMDDANVLSEQEESDVLEMAEKLKDEHDMNVIVITTRDKGEDFANSKNGVSQYGKVMYDKYSRKNRLRDNSGVVIILDLTDDRSNERFFWIYQYGTAYLTLSDSDCTQNRRN